MRKLIKVFLTSAALLLLGSSVTIAQQVPLNASLIPKFVEPLPLLEFEFINATNQDFTGAGILDPLGPGLNGTPFPVNAEEFQAQILPTLANWPTAPATCKVNDPDPLGGAANGGAAPGTASWTYGYLSGIPNTPTLNRPTYLGPVVIAERNVAANPTYGNNLPDASYGNMGVVQYNMPIDETIDWTDPPGTTGPVGCLPDAFGNVQNPDCLDSYPFYSGPMPIATHLHGGEVEALYDGGPDAWFTPGAADTGPGYPGATYHYPNEQQEGLIWFNDNALGISRLNMYAGLAGIQPIIDPANPPLTALPKLADGHHVPLTIQDRTFDTNCEIMYDLASNPQPNPRVHPFWIPEFIGETIVVNGKTWPFFDVEPRQYRFSLVNGSNSRFYELTIKSQKERRHKSTTLPMLVIATDTGYLMNAVSTDTLVIGPGERYEVVVDFRGLPANNMPIMWNKATTPYPGGGSVVKGLTDRVMQFRVTQPLSPVPDTNVVTGSPLRDSATNPIHPVVNAHDPATGSITRQLTLNEVEGAGGPLELLINNSKSNLAGILPGCNTPLCRETEVPAVGDTEIWEIINMTSVAQPIHTHLTSFQILSRQTLNVRKYIPVYDQALRSTGRGHGEGPPYQYNMLNTDGAIGGNPSVGNFLKGKRRAPQPYEMGWKDTVIAYPGEVTRIVIRWDTTDTPPAAVPAAAVGTSNYPFDATALINGVGYAWHSNILEHKDNEMMRNYVVGSARQPVVPGTGF